MFFNSLDFALFLPVVFCLYWFVFRNPTAQNRLLLAASYFFYACWDYRFLFLLMFSTGLDYFSGLKIHACEDARLKKAWLWVSIAVNLGFLGVFKYYNFFAASFAESLSHIGLRIDPWTLKVILPVGISFYTFHGISYVIDVYKGRIQPVRNVIDYSVFVSFFPLLVAGPIERASHLLPQIQSARRFEYSKAVDGLKQILWGLFKKVAIADSCAEYANMIFNNSQNHSGSAHILGAVFFAIQIYCDFSGYSDIALGTARLFGIELLRNFAYPYFSRDIAEFWRRWHISLSSWFRDYLYIPLGGSSGGTWMKIRNTFVIFLVSGFWHGANWTFLVWGALNAFYFLPLLLMGRNRSHLEIVAQGRLLPSPSDLLRMGATFCLTTFAWIFFRSETIGGAFDYVAKIFSASAFDPVGFRIKNSVLLLIGVFFAAEWLGREERFALARMGLGLPRPLRWAAYYALIFLVFFMAGSEQQFIYFQF